MDDTDNSIPTEPGEFGTFLVTFNRGRTHDELTAKMAEVVAAVADTGKAGSLTLTIKVTPAKGVDGMVLVEDDVKAKVPTLSRPAAMYYVADGGVLSENHPAQLGMFSVQGEQTR
jgi:hypothetical protein